MGKRDGGRLLIQALKREGVEQLFSLSGIHIQNIYDACIEEGMRIIDTRHEHGAASMADGWSRVTGRPGVCLVTAGPGVSNALNGLYIAHAAGSPMVCLAGRIAQRDFDVGTFQDLDPMPFVTPVTKWARTVLDAPRVPEYIHAAMRRAVIGPPGPTFLDFTHEAQDTQVEGEVWMAEGPCPVPRPGGDAESIRRAAALLRDARRPLVLAGSGVHYAGAGPLLTQMAEEAGLTCLTSALGRGSVPDSHPQCLGMVHAFGLGASSRALKEADLILAVGIRFNFMVGFLKPELLADDVKVVQISLDPDELHRRRDVELAILGDAGTVLGQIREELGGQPGNAAARREWTEKLRRHERERRAAKDEIRHRDTAPVHFYRLAHALDEFLRPEDTVIYDGGDSTIIAREEVRVERSGHALWAGPTGSLGPGIPFAMGARLARPEGRVVVLHGDGSFGFNGFEFDTAVRHDIPFITVVANDGAHGIIKHRQRMTYGEDRIIGVDLGYVRYDKIVEAMGGYGELVEEPGEITPALERAAASGKPACVNVICDPTVTSDLNIQMSQRGWRT